MGAVETATISGDDRGDPRHLRARRVVERLHPAGRSEPRLHQRVGPLGLAMEQADSNGEDDVEAAVAEIRVLEVRDEELGFPASTYAAFRRAAASIIFGERSIAVSRPRSSRSQTSVAATPWPQPISSTWSSGRMPS